MIALIAGLVETSRRHAKLITATLLALTVIGGFFVARNITIDADTDKLINPNLPWRQQEKEFDKAFPQRTDLLAIVIDARSPDAAEDAAAALATKLAAEQNLFRNMRRPDGGRFFQQNGLLFLPREEVQALADQLIAAQPLIGTLSADPSLRGVFDALDLAAQGVIHGELDPKDLDTSLAAVTGAVDAALAGRREPISWQTMLTGRKAEPLELRRFILVQPTLDYSDLTPGERATAAIHAAAAELGLTPENGVRVRVTGPPALSDADFSTLKSGAGISTVLSIGLLCLWLLLALRSLRLLIAIMITLVVGLIACASFAVGVVGPLNPISVAFAVLFIGIAIDFGIQFSIRYRDERFQTNDLSEALRRAAIGIGGPLATAAAATAVGFFSFVPTDYTGVSELGLIAGFGMLVALLLNLSLLPALLTLLRPRGERSPVGFAHAAPLDHFLVRRRAPIAGLVVALAFASIVSLWWLRFDFNPIHLQNPDEEAVSTLFDLMSDPQTTPYTIDILRPEKAVANLTDDLEKLPEVAQVLSIASYIPKEQTEKLAIIQDTAQLLGPTLSPSEAKAAPSDDEVLTAISRCAADMNEAATHGSQTAARLASALSAITARSAEVLPMLKANLLAGIDRRLDDLRLALQARPVGFGNLPPELTSEWIAADGRSRLEVFPKGDARDNEVLRRFATAVRQVAPDATGTPITVQESARTVTRAFMIAGALALTAITALLLLVLRSARDALLVLAPLILAGLLTLATSVVFGVALNFANIIALPLLLGIGVAFDIYFVMRWRAGYRGLLQSSTASAILFSALTTGTAFGSLALSHHPGMSEMGRLLIFALVYTLLCTFFVLPALLAWFRR